VGAAFACSLSRGRDVFACAFVFYCCLPITTAFSPSPAFASNAYGQNHSSLLADTTRPKISGVVISNLTSTGATISWRTDEKADSRVEYGLTARYGIFSKLDTSLVTTHSVALANLLPDNIYHFRVLSRDAAGNLAAGRDSVFTTPLRTAALYTPFEVTLTTGNRHDRAYLDVDVTGIFISPTGKELRLSGFWDGGKIWKVRFAPTEPGIWRYRTESNDPALVVSGRFNALPSNRRGFVRASKTRPYGFEYSDGTPFLLMGDTIWDGMSFGVGFETRFKPYINLRVSQHFNAYHAIVVHNRYDYQSNEGGPPYAHSDGIRDYNSLYPDYFKWADKRVAYADSMGVVSILFFSWAAEIRHMSTEQYRRLALYLVARYAAYNVFWILAGDYQAYFYQPDLYRQIGQAVAAADPYDHPISIHPADDFVNREFGKESWLSYVMHQLRDAGEFLADSIRYDRVFNKPVVNGEYGYHVPETVHPFHGIRHDAHYIRTGAWSIFTAGGYFVAGFGRTFIDPDGHYEYDPGFDHPPLSWNLLYAPDVEMARQLSILSRFFREQTGWPDLEPHPEMAADGQTEILAKPGVEYIAYKARGDRLRLRLPIGQHFSLSWFNPITGSFETPRSFTSTAETVLMMPSDTTDAIAVLRPVTAPQLAPAGEVASLQSEQLNIRQVRFRWITPQPADSRIDIQKPSGAHVQFISAANTTQHEMIIDSISPNVKYKITVSSQSPAGREWKTVTQCILTNVVVLDRYIEVETMPTKTVGRPEPPGWNLAQGGYMETAVSFPRSGLYRFEILARGEHRQRIWPKLVCEIDSRTDTVTINSAVFKWFGWTRHVTAATRNVKLEFVKAGDGRQLILDQLHVQFIDTPASPPPVIAQMAATTLTAYAATINFKTDKPAEAQVEYGLNTTYGMLTPAEFCRDTTHVFTLAGLTPNTRYHFRARAKDAAGKSAVSRDTTFTTPPDREPPVIANLAATNLTAASAVIRWTTDEKSTSQVEFGLDSTLGRATPLLTNLVTEHEVSLVNLVSYTTFHARVKSTDAYGNSAASRIFTFMTLPTHDRLVILSGEGQKSRPEKLLAAPLVVKVLNTAGAAMPNVPVAFRVLAGGGKVIGDNKCNATECVVMTAANGTASAQWQVGKTDLQQVEARLVERPDLAVRFTAQIDLTGVASDRDSALPTELILRPHPNPFRDFTQFHIALPAAGRVSLKIFDLQGREIATLFDGAQPAGRFLVSWLGRDQAQQELAAGTYFAVLRYVNAAQENQRESEVSIRKQAILYLK